MSAGGAFGGARGNQPKPPEKGVFPLDHFGECKQVGPTTAATMQGDALPSSHALRSPRPPLQVKEEYLECLKAHQAEGEACQGVAKRYLECRMERNLMAKQDLSTLGFSSARDAAAAAAAAPAEAGSGAAEKRKESTGFVAGTSRFEGSR